MRIKKYLFVLPVFIVSVIFIAGCGGRKAFHGKVIATVNGEPVYEEDFNRSLALTLKRNPLYKITPETCDDQMNLLIEKKLLLQEAVKRKLHRKQRFVDTIKTFWEQTLIRDLMADENTRLKKNIPVSDKEMREYYDELTHKKTFQIIKSKNRTYVSGIMAKDPSGIKWENTVGPIGINEVSSGILKNAFAMPKGKMDVFKSGDEYYVVFVKENDIVDPGKFDDIKNSIRKRIVEKKREKAFHKWMDDLKSEAKITVNADKIKGELLKHE